MVCGAALDPSGQTLLVIFPVCTHVPRLFHFISLPSNTCRATHSWWLASAPSECHIEFSAASISDEEMALLEQDANEAIRAAHPMHIRHYDDAPACAFARLGTSLSSSDSHYFLRIFSGESYYFLTSSYSFRFAGKFTRAVCTDEAALQASGLVVRKKESGDEKQEAAASSATAEAGHEAPSAPGVPIRVMEIEGIHHDSDSIRLSVGRNLPVSFFPHTLVVLLFCYPSASLQALISTCAAVRTCPTRASCSSSS